MKKLPKSLFAIIFMLVFAVVLLPEIKEDLSGLSAEAAEYTTTTASSSLYHTATSANSPESTTEIPEEDTTVSPTLPPIAENISRIHVHDMTFIKNYDGDWEKIHMPGCHYISCACTDKYFRYNEYHPKKITVYYSDGTEFTGDEYEVEEKTGLCFNHKTGQSPDNQWSAGNSYDVEYWFVSNTGVSYPTIEGSHSTYKTNIIETPIESIEVKFDRTKLIENVHGRPIYEVNENGGIEYSYFRYDINYHLTNITFKEGYEHYENSGYGSDLSTDQSADNPWGTGKHAATISILGYEKEFEFEVVPVNEIKDISVVPSRKLAENIDGYTKYDYIYDESTGEKSKVTYFYYDADCSEPIITIEYADGTVVSGDLEQISSHLIPKSGFSYDPIRIESPQSYESQWKIGKNTAYMIILGQVIPFEVEAVPCPVTGIEFIKAPDKTEYILGEHPDPDGAVVRISYTDGNYTDVPLVWNRSYFVTAYYDSKLNKTQTLDFKISKEDELVVSLGNNFSGKYPVTVKENLIESITIHNSENNDLIITAHNSDGTAVEMKVLSLWGDDGGCDPENEMHVGGWIITDKGIFYGYFYYYYGGHHAVQLQFWDGNESKHLESNKLADCPWLDLYYKLFNPPYNKTVKPYSGEMTEDNVDLIVLLSLVSDDSYCKHPFTSTYDDEYPGLQPIYDADYIKELINKHFVISNVDLSLSERYNPADNTIGIDNEWLKHNGYTKHLPPEYKDGYWYVEMRGKTDYDALDYDKFLYWVYDDELRIVAFSAEEMPVIEKPQAEIKQPTETVISYGDSIILHTDTSKIPEGGYIEWTASNENFDMEVSSDGSTCKISPKSKGDTTFTVTVYDAEGNPVSQDEQTMTSKAGFFDKIIAFFKKLFGLSKIFPQVYKNVF